MELGGSISLQSTLQLHTFFCPAIDFLGQLKPFKGSRYPTNFSPALRSLTSAQERLLVLFGRGYQCDIPPHHNDHSRRLQVFALTDTFRHRRRKTYFSIFQHISSLFIYIIPNLSPRLPIRKPLFLYILPTTTNPKRTSEAKRAAAEWQRSRGLRRMPIL
jgi:hypothetical protein